MAEDNKPVVLSFGGGINARQRSADIDIEECTEGENFDLNFQSSVLAGRKQFGIIAIAPNGQPIRGMAQLVKQDGTLSTIIQAGGTVFSWDGTPAGFTEIGTVDPAARLRGPIDSNFTLDNFIILTDLAKIENVKKWTGEVFTDLEHNLGVDFKAKYVTVQTERAIFANVKTGTVDTPHVILASKQGDSEILTSTIRPAAAASAEDEWFLPTPDLRPINGITFFAKTLLLSTERGRLYAIEGLIAGADTDGLPFTSIEDFHAGSAVSGDEALINIGNDVAMGLPTRIETLRGIVESGDVETNDASWWIAPLINGTFGEAVTSWLLAYDQADQRVFCFPNTGDEAWVLHKSLLFGPNRQVGGKNISPWAKWTPTDDVGGSLRPTAIGNFFNPIDFPRQLESSSSSGPALPTLFFAFQDSDFGPSFLHGIAPVKPLIITKKTGVCDTPDLIPTMTSNTEPSGEASASTVDGAAAAFNAFDDAVDTNSRWESIFLDPDVWADVNPTEFVQYQFAEAKFVNAYKIDNLPSSGGIPEATCYNWTLSAGYGGETSVVLDTVVDGVGPNPGVDSQTTLDGSGRVTKYVNINLGNEVPFDTFRITPRPFDESTAKQVYVGEVLLLECATTFGI